MAIENVETYVHPEGFCFVTVETEDGTVGVGEAGLKGRGPAIAEVVRGMRSELIGADPTRIEHLWQTNFRGNFFPGGVIQTAAVSAIDIALWDVRGKQLGVPVYDLLGGLTREKVRCYPHVGDRDTDALIEQCRDRMDDGWKFVRWSVTDPESSGVFEPRRAVRFTVEQVQAVREACGEELEICIDVHTRLDPADAITFCKLVEPYDPFFVEDPIRSEDPNALHRVRDQTDVPLAIGEQYDSKWTFRETIEEDLLDYARIDLCLAGGVSEARKIAGWCETHYIDLAPHNPLGPVSTAACLHLCLSSPQVGVQELPREPMQTLTDVCPQQVPFEDGHLLPPEQPGLGVEFDRSAFEELDDFSYPPARGYERADGAYTNW